MLITKIIDPGHKTAAVI